MRIPLTPIMDAKYSWYSCHWAVASGVSRSHRQLARASSSRDFLWSVTRYLQQVKGHLGLHTWVNNFRLGYQTNVERF